MSAPPPGGAGGVVPAGLDGRAVRAGPAVPARGLVLGPLAGAPGAGWLVRSRLLRLGVPLLVYVVLINPLTDYLGGLRHGHRSLVPDLATTEVSMMWFVAALLAFSVAYSALRCLRPAAQSRRPLPGLLTAAVLVIAVSSFAVWQLWPLTGDMFLSLRVGEWPQGVVLFALGVLGCPYASRPVTRSPGCRASPSALTPAAGI
jgi:hypothetical protein